MAESIIESKILAARPRRLLRLVALHPTKKRFVEIYSEEYIERLRNLRNLRIKNTNRPKFFRFPMATTAAWVCTAECYLLSVLKPIGL